MPDIRAMLLGVVVFAVPLYLLWTDRKDLLVKWVCLSVAVNIFDPVIFVNLPAARIAGLLLLPSSIGQLKEIKTTRAGKVLLLHFLYLALLGVIFGFVFPWPNTGFARSFNQAAQGRAVIYLVRALADLSLVVFMSDYLSKTGRPDRVLRYLLIGSCVAAIGGLVDYFTKIDPFRLITGAASLDFIVIDYRIRGFNYEPRGLGLIAAYGLVFSVLLYAQKRSLKRFGLLLLQGYLIFLTISTSAVFAVGAGLTTLFASDRRSRRTVLRVAFAGICLLVALAVAMPGANWVQTWSEYISLRLTADKGGNAPRAFLEDFALRLDIHDAAALLFMAASPTHFLFGAGPGLVTLPATDYVPAVQVFEESMMIEGGINTEPSMGLLQELANVGIFGAMLWILFLFYSARSLAFLAREPRQFGDAWAIAGPVFLVGAAIYFLQASNTSIWAIIMGIALAGERVVQSRALALTKSRFSTVAAAIPRTAPIELP